MDKENQDRIFLIAFRGISIIIIIFCLFLLLDWSLENKANKKIADSLLSDTLAESTISLPISNNQESENNLTNINLKIANPNFEELLQKNNNTIGWVLVNNTNINFPVVQTDNNNYYLKHNFNNESNGAGWIFADYKNSFGSLDDHTIIYGHNRRNNTMFSNLRKFLEPSFYTNEENKYFNFVTQTENYACEVFSVYKANANNLEFSNMFASAKEHQNFISAITSKSIHNFNSDITTSDKIITLCTCDNNNLFRIVVHAKLIPLNLNENNDNSNLENISNTVSTPIVENQISNEIN